MNKAYLLSKIDRDIEYAEQDMKEAYANHDLEGYGYWKGWLESLICVRSDIENSEA